MTKSLSRLISALASPDAATRAAAALDIFKAGRALAEPVVQGWRSDPPFAALLGGDSPAVTVGLAVEPVTFERIRAANGSPLLARVPPGQDASEFELHFPNGVSLDVLTTNQLGGQGAIARYLQKFGEGIQQIEYRATDVDRATKILKEKFDQLPVYPETRPGAGGTRVNFFLASAPDGGNVLIELYEAPSQTSGATGSV